MSSSKLKRCERGSRRDKRTGLCVRNSARARGNGLPFLTVNLQKSKSKSPKVRRERCKKGTRRNKFGICQKYPFNLKKSSSPTQGDSGLFERQMEAARKTLEFINKNRAQGYVDQLRALGK